MMASELRGKVSIETLTSVNSNERKRKEKRKEKGKKKERKQRKITCSFYEWKKFCESLSKVPSFKATPGFINENGAHRKI
jgi:hypothetical protein